MAVVLPEHSQILPKYGITGQQKPPRSPGVFVNADQGDFYFPVKTNPRPALDPGYMPYSAGEEKRIFPGYGPSPGYGPWPGRPGYGPGMETYSGKRRLENKPVLNRYLNPAIAGYFYV